MKRSTLWLAVQTLSLLGLAAALVGCNTRTDDPAKPGEPLTIAYSDWPGWLVWEIAKEKKYFDDAGVKVEMKWLAYDRSLDALANGQVDAACLVCSDALTRDRQPSTAIVLTDYSNGNDMIVAKKGIDSVKDLKGQKVGLEENLVEHILLVKALETNGLKPSDVQIVNVKTDDTPRALQAGEVAAVGAWYPIAGRTVERVPGSKAIFTSADAPGLIYDALHVSRKSLANRRDDWIKVVSVWFRCLDFLEDKATRAEALAIMSRRIAARPEELEKHLKGTKLLGPDANVEAMKPGEGLDRVHGSLKYADRFCVGRKVYDKALYDDRCVDASLVQEIRRRGTRD